MCVDRWGKCMMASIPTPHHPYLTLDTNISLPLPQASHPYIYPCTRGREDATEGLWSSTEEDLSSRLAGAKPKKKNLSQVLFPTHRCRPRCPDPLSEPEKTRRTHPFLVFQVAHFSATFSAKCGPPKPVQDYQNEALTSLC